MKPPYHISTEIVNKISKISLLLGRFEGQNVRKPQTLLRRQNKIKTIQNTLAIEGNTLDIDQVSTILENKPVIGPQKEIQEVKNAIQLYEQINSFNYRSVKDFKKAHKILMKNLGSDGGCFRSGNVGIIKGTKVSHIAPKANMVPKLMEELFRFTKKPEQLSLLILSAIFHYETEFIHPFSDGNGRMGRFWHHLILVNHHPIFEFVPFETVIKQRQREYYHTLAHSDKVGHSTIFIEFCLESLLQALNELLEQCKPTPLTAEDRLMIAKETIGTSLFKRSDYMSIFKTISTATASRDLQKGLELGLIEKEGSKAITKYRFS